MSEPEKKSRPRLLTVLARSAVTRHVVRLRLGGADLLGLREAWPGAHIKLFFPRAGQSEPCLPTIDVDGRPVWPAPHLRPVVRTYSIRAFDLTVPFVDVDFVLHGPDGAASQWAASALPGSRVGFAGPGGPRPMLKGSGPYLIAGDLSALAAIGAMLEALPEHARGACFVQIPDASEKQELRVPAGLRLTWLVSHGHEARDPALVEHVCDSHWDEPPTFVWLAGESSAVVSIRDRLRQRFDLPGARMYAVPYWKRSQTEEEYHAERHRIMDELVGESA